MMVLGDFALGHRKAWGDLTIATSRQGRHFLLVRQDLGVCVMGSGQQPPWLTS